jgi:ABC-type multidrug transport system fused ATPase/permease subunit
MSTLALAIEILRRHPLHFIGNVLLMISTGLIGMASIFSIAPVIDRMIHPDPEQVSVLTERITSSIEYVGLPTGLPTFLAIFLFINVLKNGFHILAEYLIIRTRYVLVQDLMVGAFEDFFNARWLFFSSGKQGVLMNTFMREVLSVGDAFGAMGRFTASFLQGVLYLAVPFYLSWQVSAATLATAVVFALPFHLLGRWSYRLGKENTETANQVAGVLEESLTVAKVILGFGNQHKSKEALVKAYDAHRAVTLKAQILSTSTPLMYQPLGLSVIVLALLLGQALDLHLTELAVLLWSFHHTIPLIGVLLGQKNLLVGFFPSYEQVKMLRQKAIDLKQRSGDLPFAGFDRDILLERVSFAYPGNEPTLSDINMSIPRGAMVAVVGESGAGKSTLIDVLMGFNQPETGSVTFDGVDLGQYDIVSYRQRIGYVPQDSVLFNTTLRENLRWSHDQATDDEIEAACLRANAHEFIRGFPEGYGTLVGDRGVRLSGGQRQRIALARAILRKPDLLILDEATSSLDTSSERLIQSSLESISGETTLVVIAHRLSTIANADHVYVMEQGRIVESGTYAALVKDGGHFSRMTDLQRLETAAGG